MRAMAIHARFEIMSVALALYAASHWYHGRTARLALGAYASALFAGVARLMRAQAAPWVLGKDARTGAVPAWSLAVFFPVHAANHLAYGARVLLEKHAGLKGGFEPASRHASGVWVGGLQAQEAAGAPTPFAGVVDLTNEFSERCAGVRGGPAYLNVPLWDGTAPTPAQIDACARFGAARLRARGDVLVHCAYGVGRSATVAAAVLVEAGVAPDWEAALAQIKEVRPRVSPNRRMRAALEQWTEERAKRR